MYIIGCQLLLNKFYIIPFIKKNKKQKITIKFLKFRKKKNKKKYY